MIWGSERRLVGNDGTQNIYVWAKVRPRWYWFLMRWRLFALIVWREWDEGYRLSWSTARDVSLIIHPKKGV